MKLLDASCTALKRETVAHHPRMLHSCSEKKLHTFTFEIATLHFLHLCSEKNFTLNTFEIATLYFLQMASKHFHTHMTHSLKIAHIHALQIVHLYPFEISTS